MKIEILPNPLNKYNKAVKLNRAEPLIVFHKC